MLRLHFRDTGQDILWWDIDEDNIVQTCNMQEGVWKGAEVIMDEYGNYPPDIQPGNRIFIKLPTTGRVAMFNHHVERIEKLKDTTKVPKK